MYKVGDKVYADDNSGYVIADGVITHIDMTDPAIAAPWRNSVVSETEENSWCYDDSELTLR